MGLLLGQVLLIENFRALLIDLMGHQEVCFVQ